MKKLLSVGAAVAAALSAGTANATTTTMPFAAIYSMAGGWIQPAFTVKTTATQINPDNCSQGLGAGYMVDSTAPDNQLLVSMLMTAYTQGYNVMITVSGCTSGGWPSIIGVVIQTGS